jgi:hypothetical protein
VGNSPIEAFHDEIVIIVIDPHEERRHYALDPHSIVEDIGKLFFVILWICD